jgi:hypothetical protein
VPLDWTVVPEGGRTQVRIRDVTATAAGGQVSARAEVNGFSDLPPRFSGAVQFRNVNVSRAFRQAGQVVGNLPLSGKLEFAADQYRGPNDLTAKLDARLGESQPFGLPVLSAVVPYVSTLGGGNQTAREGEIRAALAGGVWRVERATLTGSSLDLYADGTVTTGGRLNLSVTATSRQTPGQAVLSRFLPLSAVGPAPGQSFGRALVADAIGLIGNYVIHLEVTGTIDSPVVRLETLRTLTDDAIRFFLLQWATRR